MSITIAQQIIDNLRAEAIGFKHENAFAFAVVRALIADVMVETLVTDETTIYTMTDGREIFSTSNYGTAIKALVNAMRFIQ